MTLRLEPAHVIIFERPLTRIVKQELKLENPTSDPVAFKVKTTAPKLYCVRPNLGRIEPNSTTTVQVYLQAFKEEPPLEKPCKDKFLIIAVPLVGAHATSDIPELWARIETKEKSIISQYKLKCEYRQPLLSGVMEEEQFTPSVVEQRPTTTTTAAAEEMSVPRAVPIALASPAKPEEDTSKDALSKVAELEKQIKQYKEELQKKTVQEDIAPATKTVIYNAGYPVHMVILIAILAFLAGWCLTLYRA